MEQTQWKQLFAEQLSSGLSVREFCLSKSIKQKTFYTKRSAMGLSPHQIKPAIIKEIPSAFIKAQVETPESLAQINPLKESSAGLSLTIGKHLVLNFNESVSVIWLSSLIKELNHAH